MAQPSYAIDPPGPFDPPKVWWEFLVSLRGFDQNDPHVQQAKQQAVEHLADVASEHLEAAHPEPVGRPGPTDPG